MSDSIKKISNQTMDFENMSLAERISFSQMGNAVTHSGRGHGRKTRHGRGPRRMARTQKRDMLYFVRDTVYKWRSVPVKLEETVFPLDGGGDLKTTAQWANVLVNEMQFFDCSDIMEYVMDNVVEMYHDDDVPPHPDAILPAPAVGLYLPNWDLEGQDKADTELMFLCLPCLHAVEERDHYTCYVVIRSFNNGEIMSGPLPFGNIDVRNGNFSVNHFERLNNITEDEIASAQHGLRVACGLLQTINQPRFVVQGKRDVSAMKRASFKKAAGKFTPDSWNLISWNVDKPVKAKHHEEGTGGRQALHFRRGHWRKAEKDWERSRWSEDRNRWEQYIHGYEAGHPAFGVKKSYHLPRKGEK